MGQSYRREIARRALEILPLIMRVMEAQMRQSRYKLLSGHSALLGMLQVRPYTLGELAEVMSVTPPTMSNTITALEDRGWVQRERSTEDRRVVHISITAEGHNVVEAMKTDVEVKIADLIAAISEEDQAALVQGLTVLRDVFAAAVEQDPSLKKS